MRNKYLVILSNSFILFIFYFLSSLFLFLDLFATEDKSSSDIDAVKDSVSFTASINSKIFPSEESQRCKVIAKSFNSDINKYDPNLDVFLQDLISNFQNKDSSSLKKKFHPRFNMKTYSVKTRIMGFLSSPIFGSSISINLYRMWALNTKDFNKTLIDCDEEYSMNVHYGYDIQFGIWLQIMSEKELGWIYITVVPYKDKWVIGSLDIRQLTLDGKNLSMWLEEAKSDYSKGKRLSSFIKLNIAQKLSYTGGYIYIKLLDDIKKMNTEFFKDKNPVIDDVGKRFKHREILKAESDFASNGSSLYIKYLVDPKENALLLKDECKEASSSIIKKPEYSFLHGVRCAFGIKGEDYDQDGAKGSIYLTKSQIFSKK